LSKSAWKERGRAILDPLVGLLANLGVTPTGVTLFGLALHILGALWIGLGNPRAGAVVLLAAAVCDALDGALARKTGKVSRFGAFLDSTIDRIDETVVFAGIAAFFLRSPGAWGEIWAVCALLVLGGSLITSYTRARAEGLGLDCSVGVFERPERVIVTLLGLFLGSIALSLALVVLLVFSWMTVYQRIQHVQQTLRGDVPPPQPQADVPPYPPVPHDSQETSAPRVPFRDGPDPE
jgi:CDP-diacylglycerol--glycerol-3-phosphate 3-phosphatidyltransferase